MSKELEDLVAQVIEAGKEIDSADESWKFHNNQSIVHYRAKNRASEDRAIAVEKLRECTEKLDLKMKEDS